MIVSVMFYVLYPLSRLISRVSELWREAPSVYVNGKEVWDGGGALSGQQQTGLLLQWNSTGNAAAALDPDHTETESPHGALVDLLDVCELKKTSEEPNVNEMHEDVHKSLGYVNQMEAFDYKHAVSDVNLSESALKCLEVTNEEDPVMNESAFPHIEFPIHSDIDNMLSAFSQLDACAETVVYDDRERDSSVSDGLAHLSADIFLGFDSDAGNEAPGSPVFDLAALLADSQQVQTSAEPGVGWHFPVGLGLSKMSYCPYVQFPDVSYYPALQDSDSIEVMWRVWEDLSETHTGPCADTADVFDFTIMSYNILAQDLLEANPQLYTHCPEEVLVWDQRLWTILKELQIWEPDIICLQEVQENHFLEQIYPVLTDMGYTCIYKRRTGTKTDGCAVCYHSNRFTQLSVNLLEFCRSDCELLDRDNVGIVLLLQPTAGQSEAFSPICVANTHLLFNPRRGDVKLAQLAIVFAEIDVMIKKCRSEGRRCEVVLCGDFNALPNSPLWNFITTGQLYFHGLPAWMVSGQEDLSYKVHHTRLFAPLWPSSLGISDGCQYRTNTQAAASDNRQYSAEFLCQLQYCPAALVRPADLELIPGVTDRTPDPEDMEMFSARFGHTLRHTLNLTSAYSPVQPDTHAAVVSTLNSEGGAMVDHIFYSTRGTGSAAAEGSSGGLKLLGRLSLLSEADLWSLRGLPNETFPSDHLSLIVKLQLPPV
ncbi:angel -like protein [Labeo rohita]|uniref:Angel-like protein n=1 Tax=Labeo rohita TaxID=84645 RepID=A0A498MMW8_LABRO|nr:protein angel homolog 1 [Labeo rohita]XP_050988568.1 protein angel homolog 1 [Labeo rohita]XP_050988569.1 protein angel homolog 1 [Labeo rohita]RXN22819.1 angel -like protein [Labeo rohita]RXN37934.1 angel -like protein [Labeo rohita]